MVDNNLWIKSRSGNPTIRTTPFEGDKIEYIGDFEKWYRVFKMENDIIAISEPFHAQGVFCYLIYGKDNVILWDTGMGLCSIKPVVEHFVPDLSKLIVINSHTHFDHIGSNYEFNNIYVYRDKCARERSITGYSNEEIFPEITSEQFFGHYPRGYCHDTFSIPPFKCKYLDDGDVIDIGERRLTVIHTPGHSDDGIMLYDESNQLLFTGDFYYPGRLFLLLSHVQLQEYISTLDKIIPYIAKTKRLIPSHNLPQDEPHIIITVRKAIMSLLLKDGPIGRISDDFGDDFRVYDFDGCSIVLPS